MKKNFFIFIALFSLIVGITFNSGRTDLSYTADDDDDGIIEWNSVSFEELI